MRREVENTIEKKKVILEYILGLDSRVSLQEKIYNALFFISALVAVVLFIGDIVQELDARIYIASMLGSIFFATMYFISRKLKLYMILIHVFNIILVSTFIYLWYYYGGLNGAVLVIMVSMIVILPLFVKGVSRIVGVFFPISVVLVLLWYEINNPDLIQIIGDYQTRVIDKYLTAILISFSILGVVFLILHSYNKEHEKVIRLNKSKEKLLSIIAHDLINPIGSLKGLSNILLEKHDEMESSRREICLRAMAKTTEETYHLLENLLMWARAESETVKSNKQKIFVSELIERPKMVLIESANQKNIKISTEIEENLLVFVDRNMIETTIRNLISNAIKFTKEGKEICISARQNGNDEIQISVIDHGVGMSKNVKDHLFSLKKSVTTAGTNKERGTGFGLKLCKDFVERNNGKISILSEEGIGTEVILTFPKSNS